MKTNKVIQAAIPGVIAVAALTLSFRLPFDPASIVGYGAVLALLAVAAIEYRIKWKRIFVRN